MCGSTFISSQIKLFFVEMVTVFEKTVITNCYTMASTKLTAHTWLWPWDRGSYIPQSNLLTEILFLFNHLRVLL